MSSQLQTPLLSRPHFEFDSISHQLDAIEWREGDAVSNIEDLMQVGDHLLCVGLGLLPKEQGFQNLSGFLEELEEDDEFLLDEMLCLSISNKEFLAGAFASWMAEVLRDLLKSHKLQPDKVASAFRIPLRGNVSDRSWWGSCYGIAATRHANRRLLEEFSAEVLYWLENVPVMPPNSEQPGLALRLKAYWASH